MENYSLLKGLEKFKFDYFGIGVGNNIPIDISKVNNALRANWRYEIKNISQIPYIKLTIHQWYGFHSSLNSANSYLITFTLPATIKLIGVTSIDNSKLTNTAEIPVGIMAYTINSQIHLHSSEAL
jgi:hypothetical protein